eukprot:TRINITY_DN1046_c0_g1_i4.p1 TRINITY_DN1046_c0_g1~~TRINITY_DN1046_c0_g1_i4.p1  ORF type:complete len:557 (-),score=214.36 TRINITY_DN1046_c0_g1_i4:143-1813(-)
MGKRRKGSNKMGGKGDGLKNAVSDDEGGAGDGPRGMDDLYDEVDAWDIEQDAEVSSAMRKVGRGGGAADKGDMEMYALSGTDSDSDLELPKIEKKKKNKKGKSELQTAREAAEADIEMNDEDFLGSDADEGDQDDNIKAWGSKKKHFYGGNTGQQVETSDSEYSEDEAEEREARLLQERQMDRLQEEDFLDAFGVDIGAQKDKESSTKDTAVEESLAPDLSQLNNKQLAKLFKQQSPEFDGIVLDFKMRIAEAAKLARIVQLEDQKLLPKGPVTTYVRTKFQILTNYCTNISAYLMFKSKGTNLKLHPVVGRLVEYKQLLDSLESEDSIVQPQIDSLLKRLDAGESIQDIAKEEKRKLKKKLKKEQQKSQLKLLEKKDTKKKTTSKTEVVDERKRKLDDLTGDEKMAVQLYKAIKRNKTSNDSEPDENESEGNSGEEEENEEEKEGGENGQENVQQNLLANEEADIDIDGGSDGDDTTAGDGQEKRGITYQIAKNKGLTPKRNKLQRNPRVKHRVKFEKAKKRRKGAVREVRQETSRYGGEFSGINARVKKGVKIQ